MLKKTILTLLTMLSAACVVLSAQEQKQPTPEEMAAKETERLESELKLEEWQVFYVDSTLNHNYTHLVEEMTRLQRSRAENPDLYFAVRDKWQVATETAYRRFFTDEQWAIYLKRGGQRIIDEREKRHMKALGIKPEKKKKK